MNAIVGDNTNQGESLGNELARALDLGDMASTVNEQSRETVEEPQESGDGREEIEAQTDEEQGEKVEVEDAGSVIEKFTDLTALFEDQEVTAEDLYALKMTDDRGESLTVGQLKDMWQQRTSFEAQKAAFAKEREQQAKQLEEARQQASLQTGEIQQLPQEIREADADILAIERQAQSINWKVLEEDDPGEAALKQQKFRNAYDVAVRKRDDLLREYGTKRQEAWGKFVAGQREKMFDRIPEWRDNKTLSQEREAIDKLVANYGFTKQEMDSVVDPRLSQLLRDYMLLKTKFDNAVANQKEVKSRGNKVLRTTVRSKPKARLQQLEDNAKRPEASKQDKLAAQKAILAEAGFL